MEKFASALLGERRICPESHTRMRFGVLDSRMQALYQRLFFQ
jgi:hypothetical protein